MRAGDIDAAQLIESMSIRTISFTFALGSALCREAAGVLIILL